MNDKHDPNTTSSLIEPGCGACPSGDVLSPPEDWILQEMRSVKEQARPLAHRLRDLESRIKDPALFETDDARNAEWAKLEGRMASLRQEWEKWQERLDEAIEWKLICLGHRDPK